MKFIDADNWERKGQYDNFIKYDFPIFSIGTRLDVTEPILYSKKTRTSFFTLFLYILADCANKIEEFKYRIVDDKVCLYDKIDPSFVILRDDGQIVTRRTSFDGDFQRFYQLNRVAIADAQNNTGKESFGANTNDCFFVSNLPWIDLVSCINPYNFADKSQSSIPRFTWGKYVEKDGRYEMGFDVSMHHALADGVHVAKLISRLEEAFHNIEEYLKEQVKDEG